MKILSAKEFLESLNIGKLNIRDIKLPEPRLLPDELVCKYHLVLNKITGRYDCDGDIIIGKDLVKDGRLITDFGVIKGFFDCHANKLTSLEGCPTKVDGDFSCSYNKLTSLEGCPTKVGGTFNCSSNELTSLEYCPSEVGGTFGCSKNNLTSLKGCPDKVDGDFYCFWNALASLEGCPKEVCGDFYCNGQRAGHKFTKKEVKTLCNVNKEIYV